MFVTIHQDVIQLEHLLNVVFFQHTNVKTHGLLDNRYVVVTTMLYSKIIPALTYLLCRPALTGSDYMILHLIIEPLDHL
jgi:hypothetical protein